MGNDTETSIIIKARNEASRIINDAKNDVENLGKKVGDAFRGAVPASATLLAGVTAAGIAAVAFGKSSVDAYFAAAEASTKLRTNLLNVKGATEGQVQSLERLASQLQAVGVIEDDAIKAGMSQLATFNLQSSTIEKLTPKIADMVAQLKGHNATAEDMVTINNLVGKVMTGNVGSLSRYGVTLSETQKEMLKTGTETERASILTEVLAQNYGKVNEELRKTPQGMITGLKNAFGDLQEGVGELIVTAMRPLILAFSDWVTKVQEAGGFLEYFKKLVNDNKDAMWALAGAITAGVIPAVVGLISKLGLTNPVFLAILAVGALLGLVIKQIVEHFGGWGNVMDKIMPVVSGFKDFIFNDLIPAIQNLWRAFLDNAVVQAAIQGFVWGLQTIWSVVVTQVWPALQALWQTLGPQGQQILMLLAGIIIGSFVVSLTLLVGALYLVVTVFNLVVNVINAGVAVIKAVFGTLYHALTYPFFSAWAFITGGTEGFKQYQQGVVGWLGRAWSGAYHAVIDPFARAFQWIKDNVGSVKDAISNALNPFQRHSPSLVDLVKAGTSVIQGQYSNLFGSVRTMANATPASGFASQPALAPTQQDNSNQNNFYGNITLNTQEAVDRFYERFTKDGELAQMGAPI